MRTCVLLCFCVCFGFGAEWSEIKLSNGSYIYGKLVSQDANEYVITVRIEGDLGTAEIDRRFPVDDIDKFGDSGEMIDLTRRKFKAWSDSEVDLLRLINWCVDMNLSDSALAALAMLVEKYPESRQIAGLRAQLGIKGLDGNEIAKDDERRDDYHDQVVQNTLEARKERLTKILKKDREDLKKLKDIVKYAESEFKRTKKEVASLVKMSVSLDAKVKQALIDGAGGTPSNNAKRTLTVHGEVITGGVNEDEQKSINAANRAYSIYFTELQEVNKNIQQKDNYLDEINIGVRNNVRQQEAIKKRIKKQEKSIATVEAQLKDIK